MAVNYQGFPVASKLEMQYREAGARRERGRLVIVLGVQMSV